MIITLVTMLRTYLIYMLTFVFDYILVISLSYSNVGILRFSAFVKFDI